MRLRHQPSRRRPLVRVALLLALGMLLWLGGFVYYVASLPRQVADPQSVTDGIVVLTGAAARITAGFDLLLAGKAERMFISGVHQGIGKGAIRQAAGDAVGLLDCCVDLGFTATDTFGNAAETAAWVARHRYRRLRVVTSSFHMPRALLELGRRMPEVVLVPHPVASPQIKLDQWWAWRGTAALLVEEYNKYLAARVRGWLDDGLAGRLDLWLGAEVAS